MNLRGLVSVSGKSGLFKLIGQNKSGFVLESLDDQRTRVIVAMSAAKMASLEDITVFGDDGDLRLADIFLQMKESKDVPDAKSADGKTLRDFFREVAPGHDEERVYASDMKKIINWFSIIKDLPLFSEEPPEQAAEGGAAADAVKRPDPVTVEKKPAKSNTKAAGKSPTRLSQKSK